MGQVVLELKDKWQSRKQKKDITQFTEENDESRRKRSR